MGCVCEEGLWKVRGGVGGRVSEVLVGDDGRAAIAADRRFVIVG